MAVTDGPLPTVSTRSVPTAPVGAAAPPPTCPPSTAPGLVVALVAAAASLAVSELVDLASPLTVAVVIGIVAGNTGLVRRGLEPGLRVACSTLLRAGVVVFGLRLVLDDALALGGRALLAVTAIVLVTFVGTQALARRLGVSDGLGLLVATGFSICGASAIAAMDSAVDADEEDVTYAIAMVTLCGTLAIGVLPAVATWLGMDPRQFGAWTGASVHDVGQVVATASTGGTAALGIALTVKLARVVLLAPIVVWTGYRRRARTLQVSAPPTGLDEGGRRARLAWRRRDRHHQMPLVPGFVAGFLLAGAVRSTGVLPPAVLDAAGLVEKVLLSAAMVGLGQAVRLRRLRRLGLRPVGLALLSWTLVAAVSFGAISIVDL